MLCWTWGNPAVPQALEQRCLFALQRLRMKTQLLHRSMRPAMTPLPL